VRQSVLAVGGRISVRDREGGGAVFDVRLPLTPIESGALT
jgi:signal transduction histidine kinase